MQSLLLSSVSPFPRSSHHHLPKPDLPRLDSVTTTTTATATTTTTSPRHGLRAPPLPSPYLSPPMSRSPPPPSENHLDNSLRGSDRRPSSTTVTASSTTASSTTASTGSITHEPPAAAAPILPSLGDALPNQGRNDDRPQTQQSQAQPQMPGRLMGGPYLGDQHQPPPPPLPPAQVDTSAPTPAAGALSSSPVDAVYLPLTPLTTSLPPRTTRRAKAHVPSACVNCKHKHLGCDPERPCRRCVASGKEATCKDVTHKKRGRPPLRAEESLMRHFETPFGHPDPSREPRMQMSPPLTRPSQHRRTSSSREIRPMTELRFPRPGDPPPMEHGRAAGIPPPHAPLWAPPAISSSPLIRPTSSQGDLAVAGRPFSSGSSHQSTQAPPSPFFFSSPGGRAPQPHPSPAAGRARPPPPYRGFGPPPQQPSSLPAPFTPYYHPTPRSPHRPAISEASGASPAVGPPPRDAGTRPHTAESPAEFRLPPIWSSSPTSGADPTQQRRAGEMVPPHLPARRSYEQAPSQNRPREPANHYPQPLQPAFQATSAPQSRPMTARELPPSLHPPASLPPLSVPTQPADTQAAQREAESTATTTARSPGGEMDESSRPTKRRKMALGEMVNN